jgi:cbb3-type cytochrome oxidase subunit 1
MIRAHYGAALVGTMMLVIALAVAGIIQGRDLANAAVSFSDIAAHTRPWLFAAAAGQAILLVGNIILGIHFARMVAAKPTVAAANLFVQPPTMEASVT